MANVRVVACTADASSPADGASGRVPCLWAASLVVSSNATVSALSSKIVVYPLPSVVLHGKLYIGLPLMNEDNNRSTAALADNGHDNGHDNVDDDNGVDDGDDGTSASTSSITTTSNDCSSSTSTSTSTSTASVSSSSTSTGICTGDAMATFYHNFTTTTTLFILTVLSSSMQC